MKKSIAQKYFEQRQWSILEIIMVIVIIISAIVATFVWGGGPIGLPLLVISIGVLIFLKSTKIKDDEIDDELNKLLANNFEVIDSKKTIKCFELNGNPVVKGKDGQMRSSVCVVSVFLFNAETTQITSYTFDLLSENVTQKTYTIFGDMKVYLQDKTISVLGADKQVQYLECGDVSMSIPVNTNDIDTHSIVEKLCNDEKK